MAKRIAQVRIEVRKTGAVDNDIQIAACQAGAPAPAIKAQSRLGDVSLDYFDLVRAGTGLTRSRTSHRGDRIPATLLLSSQIAVRAGFDFCRRIRR